jgi:hypothetical protein
MKMKNHLLPETQPLQPQNAQHGTTFCPYMAAFSFFIPIFAITASPKSATERATSKTPSANTPVNKQL